MTKYLTPLPQDYL